jgi:DNA-binding beta-propeller fold protein YncE
MSIGRIVTVAGFAASAWIGAHGYGILDAPITSAVAQEQRAAAPQIPFHLVDNFLKLPDNITMAEVVGVSVDSKGHIYVVHRGQHPILEFNPDGSFVRSIGEGLPFEGPHTVRVDPQDNLWYVDAGNDFIVRFDPQKHVNMVLGRRPEPWTWQTHVVEHAATPPQNFYQPTDVTWGPDGSIYVADGYGNSRVAKFSKDGNLVKHWGERGTGPGEFNTPHSIVIDANNNLYVADRANARVQVFDTDGNYKREFRIGGQPWSMCLTPGPQQTMFIGSVGRVVKVDLDGKVLGSMGKFGRVAGTFDWVHGIACPDAHTVYAAQELSFRLDKLTVE